MRRLNPPRRDSLLAAALSFLFAASSGFGDWQYVPAGVPLVSAICADSSGQEISLGLMEAGYWRSMDGGETWLPASSFIRPAGHINLNSLYLLDAGADTMICTANRSYEGWNSFTFDGGQTWQRVQDGTVQNADQFLIWQADHSVWFSFAGQMLCKSSDLGQTWTCSNAPTSAVLALAQDDLHDSTLFAAGSYHWLGGGGLWRTDDLGETWTAMIDSADLPGIRYANFYNPLRMSNGELIVTAWLSDGPTAWDALFISGNEGQSWEQVSLGELFQVQTSENVFLEEHDFPGRLFMAASMIPGGVARSDDYGRTWYPAGGGLPMDSTWAWAIYQNPSGGALFAFVRNYGLYLSDDHGGTWQSVNGPPIGHPGNQLIFDDEAVFWSNWGEARGWDFQLEAPYTEWQETSIHGQMGDTAMTNWPVLHRDGNNLYTLAETRYVESGNQLYTAESHDNGLTWSYGVRIPYVLKEGLFSGILNGDSVRWVAVEWAWNAPDSLLMSEDFGHSWVSIGTLDYDVQRILQGEDAICVVTGDYSSGAVYRSNDLGSSWQHLGDLWVDPQSVVLIGDSVFAVGGQGIGSVLWNGDFWEFRGAAPPRQFGISTAAIPGELPAIVGAVPDSTTLWLSTNLGVTWQERDYVLPYDAQVVGLRNIYYDPYRDWVWAAAGIGMVYLAASELSADGPLEFKPADYTLLSVYPNPFNAETRIRYDLLKAQKVELRLYDLQGRVVRTLADEVQAAGRHEVNLEMGEMASGVYFVRLVTAEKARTEKVVLLK